MHSLKNKVALITGGAGGIGAEIVREFLKESVKHVAILDVNVAAGGAIENEAIATYGPGKIQFFKCDVTNDEELFEAYHKTMERFGVIDVVVNNAGVLCDTPKGYKKEISVNFTATVASTLKAVELMRVDEGGKGGTVINISSAAAIGLRSPSLFVYAGTKSAVLHFTNCLGMEEYYRHTNVRLITVCFGVTQTEMIKDMECIDKLTTDTTRYFLKLAEEKGLVQSPESAARGVVTSYENGETGSTWLVEINNTCEISKDVKEGFKIMSSQVSID